MTYRDKSIGNWIRTAASLGLLLTDPKLRSGLGRQVRSRVEHVSDAVANKYEDVATRFASVGGYRRRNHWPSRVTALLVGAGIGTGVAVLLAPRTGKQTRDAIRDKAADIKDRAMGAVFRVAEVRGSTGTEG